MSAGNGSDGVLALSSAATCSGVSFTSSAPTLSSSCSHRARADDRRRHARPTLDPRERDARHGRAQLLRDPLHDVEQIERAVIEVVRDARAAPRLVLALVRALVLAAERAAPERTPRRDAEAELLRHRDELALDRALEERILDLQRDERRPSAESRHRLRLRHLPGRRVAESQVANLALLDERIERAHRLLDGRRLVPGVKPVEIDVVGPQAAERFFALGDDGLAVRAAAVGVAHEHVGHELRREDDAVALLPIVREVLADDRLGVTLRVPVRRVDEVAAAIEVAHRGCAWPPPARSPSPIPCRTSWPRGRAG